MSLQFHWFLPTTGDSRSLVGGGHSVPRGIGQSGQGVGSASQFRPPTIDYLAQVARTAELLGFTGVLTPTGTWCEDAWLTTAALMQSAPWSAARRPTTTRRTFTIRRCTNEDSTTFVHEAATLWRWQSAADPVI